MSLCFVYFILGLALPYSLVGGLFILNNAVIGPFLMVVGFYEWLNRNKSAKYFTIAWLPVFSSMVIYGSNVLNLFTAIVITFNEMILCMMFGVVLLALALADKINEAKDQKYLAQKRALLLEKEARTQQEHALRHKFNSKLKDAESRAKTEFLATMSHEIRTPMNGVIGACDILRDMSLECDQSELVDIIEGSGKTLLSIINDILDFSKIEAGKMDIEHIDFELAMVVMELKSLFKSHERMNPNIRLTFSINESLPESLKGDPNRIKQILTNFLSNAYKFTESGFIRVSVSPSEDEQLVRFSVEDSGIGLSEEGQKKMFRSYSQASSDTSRNYGGTGLGLSICKKLAELMKGSVGVESFEGKGSTFWFEVPLEQGLVLDPKNMSRTSTDSIAGKRILVAEDNSVNQLVIKKMLSAIGVEFKVCENGQSAIDFVGDEEFDLVLMDCEMPVMNGYDATRAIRRQEERSSKHIPIIALTANVMKEQQELCMHSGMDDHLAKPLKKENLINCLHKHLRK